MKLRRVLIPLAICLCILLLLSACAPGDGSYTKAHPAGFFWGVWHGWIAPITLIIGLFNKNIRVYETVNTGWWYDFGFYLAIVGGFGGLSFFRKHKNKD